MSAIPAAFSEPGLAPSVWKLLRLRLVILVNGFRRAKSRAKIGYIFAATGLLAFAAFILFISVSLLNFLRSPQLANYLGNTAPFLESFPTMIISISAVGILVTSFGVLLQALYLSGDMDFLMSAPIPIRAVFISKLVQAVLPNFGFLCVLALPILFGLGISSGYNILYYPLVVVVLATISLAAASLASLLVMAVARYFPARRVAEVLGFIIGAFFLIFSQSARFMKFNVNDQQVTSMLNMTGRFNRPWSPLAWSGQGLVDLGKGVWLPAVGLLAASLTLTGLIFYAAMATSERLYYNGWSSLQNNRRKPKAKPGAQARQAARINGQSPWAGLIPAPVRAILVKDLLVYRRDLRHISQLITPLILGVVYAISLLRSGGSDLGGQGNAPGWFMGTVNSLVIYADILLALFLGWMLVANLAGLGFSQEGKNYWILKAAPIKARQLLAAKFLVGYLPSMLLCNLYLLVLQILKGSSLWSMVVSMLVVSMMLAGLNGIYLSFGTRGAKFDWENPNQMNRAVGCLGTIAGLLFLPLCFFLFIGPTFLAGLLGLPPVVGQLAGLLLGGVASAAAMLIPLGLVEKRVATLAEA
jgi:ABC-2 type transport system permease protein